MGFIVAGLAMAAALNLSDWQGLDQRAILPPSLQLPLADMQFKLLGPCSADPLVVHQYTFDMIARFGSTAATVNANAATNATAANAKEQLLQKRQRQQRQYAPTSPMPLEATAAAAAAAVAGATGAGVVVAAGGSTPAWYDLVYTDLLPGSCLNGWTMGNLAATPQAMASTMYHLLGERPTTPLLTNDSLKQMMDFQPVFCFACCSLVRSCSACVCARVCACTCACVQVCADVQVPSDHFVLPRLRLHGFPRCTPAGAAAGALVVDQLTVGWSVGLQYGLGLMNVTAFTASNNTPSEFHSFLGV